MGIWEWIASSADAVKRNTPDAKQVKNARGKMYTSSGAAFTKTGLDRLGQWMPDDETKSKIGLYTSKFVKNSALYALHEGYKLIPGGAAVWKIVSKTIKDVKYENEKLGGVEKKAGEEVSGGRAESKGSVVAASDRSPEDLIRVFMMKEFFGTRFFDDLMVSQIATKRRKK